MSDRLDKKLDEMRVQKRLLDRIQESVDDSGELNDWEDNFLESIKRQMENGKTELSPAQMEKLEGIEYIRAEGRRAYYEEYGNGGNDL